MKLCGAALLSLSLAFSAAAAPLTFTHAEYDFGQGNVTGATALADVNGDANLDILIVQSALADPNIAVVRVMLGNGAGFFGEPADFPVGPNPFGVVTGDLNHDGAVDLVVPFGVGGEPGGVTVLLGDGHGAFTQRTDYRFGMTIPAAAIANLDGDDHLDIAATSMYTDSVFVLHGRGDGTFGEPFEIKLAESQPQALTLADVNNDGRMDIITANFSNSLTVLLGRSDGAYDGHPIPVGRNPFAVISGDFNEDGKADLIVVNDFDFTYTALMGRGDGTFKASVPMNAYGFPEGAVAADFDGDGHLDFAIGNSIDGVVSIFSGRGDGTFDSGMSFLAGNNAYMLAAGDIDHDLDIDLVVANAGALSVLRNGVPIQKRHAVNPR